MRSFRHFPELACCNPTPGRISAMLRYGFSFCLCLPDTLYRFNWSPFLHGKRTRRLIRGRGKNSFDFGINISNKYSHTFEKIQFGDKLLCSWGFELDLFLVLFQSSQFALGMREWASPCLSQVCWAARARASPTCREAANLGLFSRALYRFRSRIAVSA